MLFSQLEGALLQPVAAVLAAGQVLDVDAGADEVGEDAVEVAAPPVVAQLQGLGVVRVGGAHARADEGGVPDLRGGVGLAVLGIGAAVVLAGPVADLLGLHGEPELVVPPPAFVDVEGVVAVEGAHQVAAADGAAEPLEAVVLVVVDLHVLDDGAPADAAHGQAVDLVAGADVGAAVADRAVAEDAGVVAVVGAAVGAAGLGGGNALDGADAGGGVDHGLAENDDAAPQAAGVEGQVEGIGDVVGFGGEDDGVLAGPLGEDPAALGHDEGAGVLALARLAADDGAGLDGEGGAVVDEDEAVEDVGVVRRPRGVLAGVPGDLHDGLRRRRDGEGRPHDPGQHRRPRDPGSPASHGSSWLR